MCYNKVCSRGGGRAEEGLSDSPWGSGWLPAGGSDLDDLETVVVWGSCRDCVGVRKVEPKEGPVVKALLWGVRKFGLS